MDHLDKLHELSMRRAEMMDIPTVKELIELELKECQDSDTEGNFER